MGDKAAPAHEGNWVGLAGIDGDIGSQFLCQAEFGRARVHGNNGRGSGEPGPHQGTQTHAAQAKDNNGLTWLHLGRVDDGSAATDYDEEEIARKMSIAASMACVEWDKTKINLIDTPGFNMFVHEAKLALPVVDAAIVVVDGVGGVDLDELFEDIVCELAGRRVHCGLLGLKVCCEKCCREKTECLA